MRLQTCRRHPEAGPFLAECFGCKRELHDIAERNHALTAAATAIASIRITRADASGLYAYGITGPDSRGVAEVGLPTAILPNLIKSLTDKELWEDNTLIDGSLYVRPDVSGVSVVVTEIHSVERQEKVFASLPEAQRMPLASALARALDVAHSWEG